VSQIFETVESGRPLSEAIGEHVEKLYAETMVLVSASDGAIQEREARAILENMAGDPVFREVSRDVAESHLRDAVQNLATMGVAERLAALAHGLRTRAQRIKAFALAARIADAEGERSQSKVRVLELLQTALGLSDAEVSQLTVGG
jgi:tellurite resistance protein